ncbi:MAG: efflux RND transporter periplasmic adaptor subunit [Desulfobacterales bacterium]|nr:efflux RND transporter periplasmic adaptor subunit [Desulfobacterales bacterium]
MNVFQKSPKALKIALPLLILVLAAGMSLYIFKTRPQAPKREITVKPPVVETFAARIHDHPVTLSAMGTVIPSTRTELKVRVSGEVMWVSPHLEPGVRVQKGEPLMRLDQVDLKLALATAQANLQQAKADLALEEGNQEVARNELALMEKTTGRKVNDQALALRKPQLAKARASVALAKTDVRRAQVNLKRSVITAPFDGLILTRNAPLGSLASNGQTVAEIAEDGIWWVEASLPMRDLTWLRKEGSARIITQTGAIFEGRLLRLLGDLNATSRMARLLIEVKNPMNQATKQKSSPLLLQSYVDIKLQGNTIASVVAVPDKALRNGPAVWVVKDEKLYIKKVTLARREEGVAYIQEGLEEGDLIILTQLASPVDGMAVRMPGKKIRKP